MNTRAPTTGYRGRIAPSPTGFLHLGHARTFWTAQKRARGLGGKLLLRIEDLDHDRCRPEFRAAIVDDLRWFGFAWDEGPILQSERDYFPDWETLRAGGFIYPCTCSRRDVRSALGAPHEHRIAHLFDDEPMYPGTCRPAPGVIAEAVTPAGVNWRFRVPDGERLTFFDERLGEQSATAGVDFGDFVVWRKDSIPAYQLAVVADDAAMRITEVARGEDLLTSTFRQLLLYRALGLTPPRWFHCPLILDENGERLAKRNDALSLRALRERGVSPEDLRRGWG